MNDLIDFVDNIEPRIGPIDICPFCSDEQRANTKYKTKEICAFISGEAIISACSNGHVFSFWPSEIRKVEINN